ncbi:MAG: NAD(P)/FAD-dependent oxidoreductase [Fimbriimonadales bacterium]
MSSDSYDIAVVGAGPVGLFAAFYAGIRGMRTLVVDSLHQPGGQLAALYPEKPIYDMPGFPEILAKDLAQEMMRQAERFSPTICLGEQSISLSGSAGNFTLATSNSEFQTKTVLVCAGVGSFSPTKIGIDTEAAFGGKGVSYGVLDPENHRDKAVVVVGGGDSALDWALAILPIAKSVTLIHRRDKFRAHEDSVQKMLASSIVFRPFETIEQINGGSWVTSVTTQNTQTKSEQQVACDSLIVCIGYKTDLGPIRSWGLEMEKTKIRVSERMETNISGVFAAGDVCTHSAKLDLIATGVGEACIAVNFAKTVIDPDAKLFPGHSSDMSLPELK